MVRVKPQSIHGKKDTRFAQALDSENNSLHVKDMVKVVDGPHAVQVLLCIAYVLFKLERSTFARLL